MDIVEFFKKNFLNILGTYTLFKFGYDHISLGRYYTFFLLKRIPTIKKKIEEKKKEIRDNIKKDLNDPINKFDLNLEIPTVGLEKDEIVEMIQGFNEIVPYKTKEGRVSGCVYSKSEKIDDIFKDVFPLLERSNPLHPDVFPGVLDRAVEEIPR